MSQKQKQEKPASKGTDSPKGGSTLFSKGTKSVAAEHMFGEKERDKDGNVIAEQKQAQKKR